jgi:hypothetical protein
MSPVQTGEFRELLLRDPLRLADLLDSMCNYPLDVLQPIRLWSYAAVKHPA